MIATMAVLIALAAVAGAAVFAVAVWILARRTAERKAQAHATTAVGELATKVEELSGELRRALERSERGDGRRELTASIELEVVVARILEAATELTGVDAVVVAVAGTDDGRLVAAVGMPQEEAEKDSYPGHLPASSSARSRIARPLEGELGELGFIAVYSRSMADLGATSADAINDLAQRAGPAVDNALRYREARRLADVDGLTGLRNRRFFYETLQRECTRAQRYGRRLALVVLDVDNFKAINEKFGHLAGDAVLAEAAARLRSVLRASDVACRIGGDEFAIILPEAGIGDAQQLYLRAEQAVAERSIGNVANLTVSAGVAELSEGDDVKTLFERGDDALYQAKRSGKARVFPGAAPDGERASPSG